ncbi:MAG: H-NS histone family protein [Succinivibrio sp.]|nr:H-NS histone family protein [Succinivibrio sp.]
MKAFFKEASSSEISSILEKLAALRDEVKAEETAKELAEKQRQEFLSGLLNDLDNHNFTIEDLATLKGIQTKLNRPKMKARYEYEGIDGQMYLWSGQGKIPKAMAEVMKRDNITDKNHYLIDKE